MVKNKDLVKSLKKDITELQQKIEHPGITNLKIYAKKAILQGGIILNNFTPYVMAAIITANSFSGLTEVEEIEEPLRVQTTVTSTGIEKTTSSFDYKYDNNFVQYSTGWKQNENGLYEREVTTYLFNNMKNYNFNEILSLSNEELKNLFTISNVEKIKKEKLSSEDSIYQEDMVIITTSTKDYETFILRQESFGEQAIDLAIYIILIILIRFGLCGIAKIFFRTPIHDKLKTAKDKLIPISGPTLENLRETLKIKQENLALLQNETLEAEKTIKLRQAGGK